MNSPQNASTPNPVATLQPETIYSVGTLRYNKNQLVVLFVWLMWNDFGITLIERIGGLNGWLMRERYGATFYQMNMLGMISGFFMPWINPWVSTWSDRLRSPYGRRRPFLLVATPFFAFFLILVPFMPDFAYYLSRNFPVVCTIKHAMGIEMNGTALMIGLCGMVAGVFNAVVLAIFSYLYWDVVPENLLGRFNALSKNIALIAMLIWSFFIYGQAEHHTKWVYAGTAVFSLAIYLLSVWKVKEGEYPPPEPRSSTSPFAPIHAYFSDCFSKPFYLWIFIASFLYQVGNLGGGYQWWFYRDDLHLDLQKLGNVDGTTNLVVLIFGTLCGFYVGFLTDKLKPVRIIGISYFLLAGVVLWTYFYVHDVWSYLISFCVRNLVMYANGVIIGALTVEVFPREKLGQFCSAQAMFYQFLNNLLGPPVGKLFDWLHNNRLGFAWMAFFYAMSGVVYIKVYFNWKRGREAREQKGKWLLICIGVFLAFVILVNVLILTSGWWAAKLGITLPDMPVKK